jgi:diguanylate cyclase (GGDEF)-like protein
LSAHVDLPLVLLTESSEWARPLRDALAQLGNPSPLITAPSWQAACGLFDQPHLGLLLCTPEFLPELGQCPLPILLLLETEPEFAPAGVCDWLVRSHFSPQLLRRCMRYAGENAKLKRTLQGLAEQDPLTGIANRQGFHTLLNVQLSEFCGSGLALAHVDLDSFRHANEALGYQAGDRLLLQVVARLREQLEGCDQLARLGGDEFALLLDVRRDPARAERLVEQIIQALAEPYWVDGESLLIGASIGLASASAEVGADALMWHAHIAMQQAKLSPGCSFSLFDPRNSRSEQRRAELEGQLRRALRRDELVLHYQPRLCLHTGAVLGLEALVRWQHSEQGLLGPNEFIPLAEETGLIIPLGYWVISQALRDMQWLLGRGVPPLHMAINLSFRQFQDSQLLPTLRRLINERGVAAQWLEFELTETAVMRGIDQVQQTMQALGELGVQFALDDFGTGFSSFMHLHSLPITLLKIDKSFVAGMGAQSQSYQLVQAMINLAHNLHLQVVAEGVESAEQLALLRQFGCDQVQGYLISKPLPLNELTRFLVFGQRQPLLSKLSS